MDSWCSCASTAAPCQPPKLTEACALSAPAASWAHSPSVSSCRLVVRLQAEPVGIGVGSSPGAWVAEAAAGAGTWQVTVGGQCTWRLGRRGCERGAVTAVKVHSCQSRQLRGKNAADRGNAACSCGETLALKENYYHHHAEGNGGVCTTCGPACLPGRRAGHNSS